MTRSGARPVVPVAIGALLVAFVLALGIGLLTKKSTVAAPIPRAEVVALPTEKPQVASLQTGGDLPALKVKRKPSEPASSTGASPSAPATSSPAPSTSAPSTPSPQPAPAPKPKPKPKPEPSDEVVGGGEVTGGG